MPKKARPKKGRSRPLEGHFRPMDKTRSIQKTAAFWDRLARQEPNNAEMTLFGILCYMGLEYKYTGNAQFILMGKCPDFVHVKDRKIIELYGERWHRPEEEQQRIDLFARSDYQVLVVWQRELTPKHRKKLYHRLLEFDKLDDIVRTTSNVTRMSTL